MNHFTNAPAIAGTCVMLCAGVVAWTFSDTASNNESVQKITAAAPVTKPTGVPAAVVAAQEANSKSLTASDQIAPAKTLPVTEVSAADLATIGVTEEEVAECAGKLWGKKWDKCSKQEQNDRREYALQSVRADKMAKAGLLIPRSYRQALTEGPGKLSPLLDASKLSAFVFGRATPGAYLAAAGADRDESWLNEGLEKFPGDPLLLKAKAMMDYGYLKDPSLIQALRTAAPDSGWPDLMSADVALGQKQPKSAYDAVRNALDRGLSFSRPQEIQELVVLSGVQGVPDHYSDIGDVGTRTTGRMAGEFIEEAKIGQSSGDSTYYAAAALALYDVRTDSASSEEAKLAAQSALDALKLLGPDHTVGFLGDRSFTQAQSYYREVIASAEAAKREALAYRATLNGEARKKFDLLRNQVGSKVALVQTKVQ